MKMIRVLELKIEKCSDCPYATLPDIRTSHLVFCRKLSDMVEARTVPEVCPLPLTEEIVATKEDLYDLIVTWQSIAESLAGMTKGKAREYHNRFMKQYPAPKIEK